MKQKPLHKQIVTSFDYPPIPVRGHDWSASFDWFDGDDDQPIGYGETEEEAVLSLLQAAWGWDTAEEDGMRDQLVSMALEYWSLMEKEEAR